MTLIPLHPTQWDTSLTSIIDDMKGEPLNVHRLMAHNPALLSAWWNLRNYLVTGGSLGKRRGELLILRVAVRAKAWYEWGSHVDRALDAGLTLDDINCVQQATIVDHWDIPERDLLAAADQLFDNHRLSQDFLERLAVHFSPAEIMDMMALHGMYTTLAHMINTWGLELDDAVRARLPDGVTRDAFEHAIR